MNDANTCKICNSPINDFVSIVDTYTYNCPKCGQFSITFHANLNWKHRSPDSRDIANASGWIREHQGILINSDNIDSILAVKTPSVTERATKILLAISKLSPDISHTFDLTHSNSDYWLAISYSANTSDLKYLFKEYLQDTTGYISFSKQPGEFGRLLGNIQITPRGYEFLESLKQNNTNSQIGFCAMWFNETVLPIWKYAIELAINDAGYDPKRIDTHEHNNRIDDEIIAMLRRSKFVVADFTGQRGGVYFEAGFALGLGLPVIWTCKKSELENNHFDTRQYNFVTWESDKLDEFKVALQNRIEATIGRGTFS